MIEKNSVGPSINSLKKVLAGIPQWVVEFSPWMLEPDSQGSGGLSRC
jgi:hypothetical protein